MTRIFISHSTKDKATADGVLEHLRAAGYSDDQLFLDDDEQSGILAGLRWETQLFTSLEDCACLIVVCSRNWLRSKWCFAEALIAKNLDRRIIPLLVDISAEQKTLISEFQAISDFQLGDEKRQELSIKLERLKLLPDKESDGWKLTSTTPRQREKIAADVRKQLPPWWNVTQLLIVAIFAIVLTFGVGAITFAVWEPVSRHFAEELHFAEEVHDNTNEFLKIVVEGDSESDPHKLKVHEGNYKIKLTGNLVAHNDHGIQLNKDVEIHMKTKLPKSLPDPVTFRCFVDRIDRHEDGYIVVFAEEFEEIKVAAGA